MAYNPGKRAILYALFPALFSSLLFTSCTPCPQWCLVKAADSCSASYRLSYNDCDPFTRVQIELIQSPSGLRMYLNTFSLPLASSEILVNVDATSQRFSGYLLEGDQRVLLPEMARDWIIAALLADSNVTIGIGPYETTISPIQFAKCYFQMS